jgi:hypothetical protein
VIDMPAFFVYSTSHFGGWERRRRRVICGSGSDAVENNAIPATALVPIVSKKVGRSTLCLLEPAPRTTRLSLGHLAGLGVRDFVLSV